MTVRSLTTDSLVLLHWLEARSCGTHFVKDSFSKNASASFLKITIDTAHRTLDHDRAVTWAEGCTGWRRSLHSSMASVLRRVVKIGSVPTWHERTIHWRNVFVSHPWAYRRFVALNFHWIKEAVFPHWDTLSSGWHSTSIWGMAHWCVSRTVRRLRLELTLSLRRLLYWWLTHGEQSILWQLCGCALSWSV